MTRRGSATSRWLGGIDNYVPEPNCGCWLWLGAIRGGGYGIVQVDGRSVVAHRLMYEREVGPIPDGLQLDHKCRVRCCVNPDHLEPVSVRENVLRGVGYSAINAQKTSCLRGHSLDVDGSNVRLIAGRRYCRSCQRDRQRNKYQGDEAFRLRAQAASRKWKASRQVQA